MRTKQDILSDVQLMATANLIRFYLRSTCPGMQKIDDAPNGVYGHTLDGLVVYESSGHGHFDSLGTPFGTWRAVGGGCPPPWSVMDRVKERLGLVLVKDRYEWGDKRTGGYAGAVYAITKDLQGRPLQPAVFSQIGHVIGRQCVNLFVENDRVRSENEILSVLVTRLNRRERGDPVDVDILDLADEAWHDLESKLGDWKHSQVDQ